MKTKFNFYNVFDNDYPLFELCEKNGWINEDSDEEFDALSFFEGDPDMIKINGQTGYFAECGEKVFIYFDDFKGHAEKMLQIFFDSFATGVTLGGDSWLSRKKELPETVTRANTWEEWDEIQNGIAWRGGAGYVYALFNFDEWAEQNDIVNYSTK